MRRPASNHVAHVRAWRVLLAMGDNASALSHRPARSPHGASSAATVTWFLPGQK